MSISEKMLRLSLTDTYDFESIVRATQMKRFIDAMEQCSATTVKQINTFLDDTMPASTVFDAIVDKLSKDGDWKSLQSMNIVKHNVALHRTVYDLFNASNEFVASFWATIVGDYDNVYVTLEKMKKGDVEQPSHSENLKEVSFEFYGHGPIVEAAYKQANSILAANSSDLKRSVIRWRYSTGHGAESMLLSLNKTWDIYQEAYPWITKPLAEYYDAYTASNSSILICYGPPGTGKTSFIRDYLCEQRLNALVSYDASILASDEMFTFFLSSPAYDVLVIEDADDMLTSDRDQNNKMIAKLLNTSDGLLKLPHKKVILSTNLQNLLHIDEAITRPGRCFDLLNFRKLTHAEQVPLCKKLGLTSNLSGEASLAEIYKEGESSFKPKSHKLGFL